MTPARQTAESDDNVTTYRLTRMGDMDLCFDGELLADLSSYDNQPATMRWTEIRIYRTASGKWVTEMVGCTKHAHEVDRRKVTVCDIPQEVPESLRRSDTSNYLTHLALEAMRTAATVDPALVSSTAMWI